MASPIVVPPEMLQKSPDELRMMLAEAIQKKEEIDVFARSPRAMRGARRSAHRQMLTVKKALKLISASEEQHQRRVEE